MKKYINYIILISSFCYFIFVFIKNLIIPYPVGDEGVFLRDLLIANSNSYSVAISYHISIPYTYLTLLIYKIIGNAILALRWANFILTISCILFLINSFKKIHSVEKLMFFITYLFFFIGTVGYFFMGTNDILFNLGLIILTIEVYLFLMGKGINFMLILIVLTISAATRSMILIYLPLIFISTFILLKHNFTKKILLIILVPIICIIALNFTNLINGFGLSYDNKNPPKSYSKCNWTQRQYLSQLKVNDGTIPNKSHVSWGFVSDYLKINGEHSLPSTLIESLCFDIKLTMKEFVKDFLDILFFAIRQLGLAICFIFYQIYLIFAKRLKYSLDENLFTQLVVLFYVLFFSFIIISFVELRWLCVPFLLSIFYFVDKCKLSFLFYNNIFLFLLMIYSIVKNNL